MMKSTLPKNPKPDHWSDAEWRLRVELALRHELRVAVAHVLLHERLRYDHRAVCECVVEHHALHALRERPVGIDDELAVGALLDRSHLQEEAPRRLPEKEVLESLDHTDP